MVILMIAKSRTDNKFVLKAGERPYVYEAVSPKQNTDTLEKMYYWSQGWQHLHKHSSLKLH